MVNLGKRAAAKAPKKGSASNQLRSTMLGMITVARTDPYGL